MIGSSLFGVEIIPVPDDDERMKDVPVGHASHNGGSRMLVRESDWPLLRAALLRVTVAAPASPTPEPDHG